jgi:DNA-binding beta-propeller fold protein YncE
MSSCVPKHGAAAEASTRVIGGAGIDPGRFRQPRAIAVDGAGRCWVADRTGRIQVFDAEGQLQRYWSMPEFSIGQSVGLAIESEGTLLVSDTHYQRVFRYDISRVFLGNAVEVAHADIVVPAPRDRFGGGRGKEPGQFTWARDVVADSSGAIYVGDSGGLNDRIQKFSSDGTLLTVWGRHGSAEGELDLPGGLAIEIRDGREFLLVADCNNHRIQRFDLDGRFVSAWGELGDAPGFLRYPKSVAVASNGDILVAEWGNSRIQRFTSEGVSIGVRGKPGRGLGELLTPWDLAIGPSGAVFVVDYGNHRVQVFE